MELPGQELAMDCSWIGQVPSSWEDHRQFRTACMEGRSLTVGVFLKEFGDQEVVLGTLACCKLNVKLLRALLDCMATTPCIFNPPLHVLQAALLEFYALNHFPDPDDLAAKAHKDGWGLKRMLSFLRRKFTRTEMPRVP